MPRPFPRKRYLDCPSGLPIRRLKALAWEPVAELGMSLWRFSPAQRVLGIGGCELPTVSGGIPKRQLNFLEKRLVFAAIPPQHSKSARLPAQESTPVEARRFGVRVAWAERRKQVARDRCLFCPEGDQRIDPAGPAGWNQTGGQRDSS